MSYNKWDTDLSDSILALKKIKDNILPTLLSGEIHCIESSKDFILMKLDAFCGVDYIREDNIGLQGVAARVQWMGTSSPYNTFTIRTDRHSGTKTELSKRVEQIENGYFYPAFTLQAYFDNRQDNNLLSIAVVRTMDLYSYLISNPDELLHRESDNKFVAVNWDNLIKHNVNVKIKINK